MDRDDRPIEGSAERALNGRIGGAGGHALRGCVRSRRKGVRPAGSGGGQRYARAGTKIDRRRSGFLASGVCRFLCGGLPTAAASVKQPYGSKGDGREQSAGMAAVSPVGPLGPLGPDCVTNDHGFPRQKMVNPRGRGSSRIGAGAAQHRDTP